MDLQANIEKFFADYIRNWNAQDLDSLAAAFSEPCIFVLSSGTTVLPDNSSLKAFYAKAFDGLRASGFNHSTLDRVKAQACADGLAIVDVLNVIRHRKDNSVMEAIDCHFTMRQVNGVWKIVTAVWCTPGWRET